MSETELLPAIRHTPAKGFITKVQGPAVRINPTVLVQANRHLAGLITKTKDARTRRQLQRIQQANTKIILTQPY